MDELYTRIEQAILEKNPQRKCDLARSLDCAWREGRLEQRPDLPILSIDDPGRPERPKLVHPRQLSGSSTATEAGRIVLIHALAHIEFNAINIALDAAYRFRNMPRQYVSDWLKVACEEAMHFGLFARELELRSSCYGALDAHAGLWDMVCKTRHDHLHRMALVPRVMEARGLDVTPSMIRRFEQSGDQTAVEILQIIYQDEITHVRIGNQWYQYLCAQRGIDAQAMFRELVSMYMGNGLRGPFNWPARMQAGFSRTELEALDGAG